MRDDRPQEEPGDELDALRELWQREAAEAPALPEESLKSADASTRRAVLWLQEAWALEASQGSHDLPQWVRDRQPNRRSWRPAIYVTAALAATALAALLAGRFDRRHPGVSNATDSAVVAGGADAIATERGSATAFQGDHFTASESRMELVTGKVRVILLQPQNSPPAPR